MNVRSFEKAGTSFMFLPYISNSMRKLKGRIVINNDDIGF